MTTLSRCSVLGVLVVALQGCGGGGGGSDALGSDTSTATPAGTTTTPVVTTPAPVPAAPVAVAVESSSYLSLVSDVSRQQLTVGTQLESFNSGILGGAATGWIYEPGSEYPGARGGLSLIAGQVSPSLAASLQADLNCGLTTVQLPPSGCGLYVAMTRKLGSLYATATPDTAMISLNVQASQPLISTGLRVVDGTGQILQFKYIPRTLETNAGASWARVLVPVGSSKSYWGGANDGNLHNGITSISLTTSAAALAGPAANLNVDELKLLESGAGALAVSRQSAVLTNGVIPTIAGRFAVANYKLTDTLLAQAASIGVSVIRMDLSWSRVEVGGKFDFSAHDKNLKALQARGMSALMILGLGHPDHGGSNSPVSVADRAAFAEYARQAALFAKGRNVAAFEVWNEPDHANFWAKADPETYAQALGAARQAVKSVDPTRKVVNGGPSWVALPYIHALAKTGQLKGLDGFAIHGYKPGAPEGFAADLAPLKAVLSAQGVGNLPIWLTETGYSSVGQLDASVYGDGHDARARARQAVLVLRTVLTQTALNLPMMTIYALNDYGVDPNNGEHNFGLLTQAGDPKPAFNALKTLYGFTGTRNYIGLVKDVPANVHAMRWDGASDSVFAVWTESTDSPVTLTLPKTATVTSLSGAKIATTSSGSSASQVRLTEAMGPVFVQFSVTTTQ